VIGDVVAAVLILGGVGFLALGVIGTARTHAVAKAETLGMLLVFGGLLVTLRGGAGTAQLALIALFSFLVNPTATHALARVARRRGVTPWHKGDPR
jgi:multicomponent Na+:H+ antiporter subunit G